jgi:aspartyl-tRNA(Asn)/glutamyl-tRNA(Gln) amidotransferase subunit A
MAVSQLWQLSLREAADALARRELTAEALLDATLGRLEATEPAIHAYVTVMEAAAREQAAAADGELRRDERRGPLHGIPVAVKDLLYTQGVPTQAGSRMLADFLPAHDATVVERLRSAGAVLIGKTVTHEFAYGQNVPPTRNPWDSGYYPGGSSAGSGVAVAVGSAFAAIGTDTAGSIRVPASINGVVGLKPTYGRVSRHGVIPMSPSLDSVGPLARTAEDCALVFEAIAGYDPRDPSSLRDAVADPLAGLDDGLADLRLGLDREYFLYEHVEPDVRRATEVALDQLRALGGTIVHVEVPGLEVAAAAGLPILRADTSAWHRRFLRERAERYHPGTRVMLELGELVPATQYVLAQRACAWLRDQIKGAFMTHRLDCLVSPMPITTVPLDQATALAGTKGGLSTFVHHCFLGNVVGLPALTFPCGFSSRGLPIGFQVYGRPLAEATLFRIARAYQDVTDWHLRRPLS